MKNCCCGYRSYGDKSRVFVVLYEVVKVINVKKVVRIVEKCG